MSVGILVSCRREQSLDTDCINADMTEATTEGTKCGIADGIEGSIQLCFGAVLPGNHTETRIVQIFVAYVSKTSITYLCTRWH